MRNQRPKRKLNITEAVHWLIAACILMGAVGAVIQLIRWGHIVESGGIGPTGW